MEFKRNILIAVGVGFIDPYGERLFVTNFYEDQYSNR